MPARRPARHAALTQRRQRFALLRRRGVRATVAAVTASLTALAVMAVGAGAASAAPTPVYQITGAWAPGTPASTSNGKLVTAVWRVNVNDSANPPANDPVPNVNFSVTAAHGKFAAIPTPCKTSGVTPASSISADGATLVCNLGTVKEGTAEVVQAPMTVNGLTGDKISATGTIAGQTTDLPPIPISNVFGEDILWGTPSAYDDNPQAAAPVNAQFDLEWSLRTKPGSDPGPNSVTYNLTITQNTSSPSPKRTLTVGAPAVSKTGCTDFGPGIGRPADGHPWSDRPGTGDENAPFVQKCTLTRTDNTHFKLTLTGIDYSKTTLPTQDSTGAALPKSWDVVASGSIWLTIHGMTVPTGMTLTSSAPTYRSVTGKTSKDAAGNNTSTKALELPGDWSSVWSRGFTHSGGSNWDNSYHVPQGTLVQSTIVDRYGEEAGIPNNSVIAECDILDRKFVTFNSVQTLKTPHTGGSVTPFQATISYYTGAGDAARAKYLEPNNAAYDPNAFRGCSGNAGWTTTKPANGQILAVRATWPKSRVAGQDVFMRVDLTVHANAPVGQDVWSFAATRKGSTATWDYPGRQLDSGITPVPNSRYHYTDGGRDVLHVTGPIPVISKSANPKVVTPGAPATFTLRYQMQGGAGLHFNNVRIVDTLPAGMTYVAGSGKPAPTTVSGQTLTWVLNGVPSNTPTNITYQASVAGVAAGQAVTNNVAMTAAGQTARASAQVTVATSGFTSILKTSDQQFIPNLTGDGSGTDSWTVTVTSSDPLPQPFTDTIDVLPYNGDGRGTSFHGSYTLGQIAPPAGATVYYTTADPSTLSDDPHDPTNGTAPGSIAGNSVGWSTTYTPAATAIRIIGPRLNPGETLQFKVPITNSGAQAGDAYVNRAQGVAGHTQLVMRTSAAMTEAQYYAATIKKFVQDVNGNWHDANGTADYPAFHYGDTIHYKEVITNVGQGTLTDINITDDKQPQLGAFHIDSLASGKSQEHDYSITLGESANGNVVNNACATAATPPEMTTPPDIGCDPAGFKVTNYITTKTADPDSGTPVSPGQTIKYTITVTQQGTEPADAQFSDDLAKVLDDADYNNDVKADLGTATFDAATKTLAWTGTVPVGGVAHVTYSVTVHDAATLAKTGSDTDLLNPVTSPGCVPKDGQFPDCTTDHKTGYYTYSKVSDPKSGSDVGPKDVITYTIVVVQHGQGPVTSAKIVDDMTKALDDAKYQKDAKASSGTVTYKAPKLFWTGDLAVGQQVTITYTMKVTGAGDEKLANVVTDGKYGLCDTSIGCKTHHQYGDYTFEKNSNPAPGSSVHPGDTISYTLTIMQHGPGAVADATVTDDMSQLLDDADFNNDAKATAGTLSYAAPKLIWKGSLAVGAKVTITYSVKVTGKGDQKLGNKITDPTDPRGSCDASGTCKTTHQIASPIAPAGTGGGGSLAFTGDNIQLQLVVIGLLLATGGLLVTVSLYRRRRNLG